MANYTGIIDWVLRIEDSTLSGKVVDLGDGQGLTRYGIAQKSNPEVPPTFYTESPLFALGTAQQVYRSSYWNRFQGDNIDSDAVASCLLNFSINDGTNREVRMLQEALGLYQRDGVMGPITLKAVNSIDGTMLAATLRTLQAEFYQAIPNNEKFISGWLKRAALVYPNLGGL